MAEYINNSILDGELLPFAAESQSQGQLEKNFHEPYMAWKTTPTPQTRAKILTAMQPTIDRTVDSYGGHPYLRGQAKRIAIQSLNTYDPAKGKLQTHLQTNLKGLQRLAAKQDQIISIPERVMLDRKNLRDAEVALEDQLGRIPSVDELANYTGFSYRRIEHIRKTKPAIATGAMRTAEGGPVDVASSIPGKNPEISLWERFVYDGLSPRDKLIYDTSLGAHGTKRLSADELAVQLNITPAAVSQRKAAIQRQLDQQLLEGME